MNEAEMWVKATLPIFDRLMTWLCVAFLLWLFWQVAAIVMRHASKPGGSIYGKAVLYAIPLFLAPCVEKLADILMNDQWPTLPRMVFCLILGLSNMCIGLRAYFDGSYERDRPKEVKP